jgi:hypothetical protein
MPNVTAALVTTQPIPVLVVEHNEPDPKWLKDLANSHTIENAVKDLLGLDYFRSVMGDGCRGVPFDRLGDVMAEGVDVRPTDSVIWVDHLDKAVEYGSEDGVVIMVFDRAQLKPASIVFPKSTSEEELAHFANDYPTRVDDYHGDILISRCGPKQDPGYGLIYGSWIQSNAFDALRMVLVIAQEGHNAKQRVVEIIRGVASGRR